MHNLNEQEILSKVRKYSNLAGISGHESKVKSELIKDFNRQPEIEDTLGSVLFHCPGINPQKKVAIIAHLDEVGFVVKNIDESGLISFTCVGGIDPLQIINARVQVDESVEGIILKKPKTSEGNELKLEDLVIDCGFSSQTEAAQKVKVGSPITFVPVDHQLSAHRYTNKALDNRVGVAICALLGEYYQQNQPSIDLYIGATVQEELGLRGAKTLGSKLEDFDLVIVLDVSPVDDYGAGELKVELGSGFLLRIKDPYMIFNYDLICKTRALCEANNIKYQEYFSRGGTDSAQLEIARQGNKVIALCVGARNIHSPAAIVDLNDVNQLIKAIIILIGSL